ncbi:MAG: MoxR family ATPase, partial [Actinomycetota bacterium]
IGPVTDALGLSEMIAAVRGVHVADALRAYIVEVTAATRNHPDIYLGASPRASIMLLRAARAMAASNGRDYVIPDDVKALAVPVLAHRVIAAADAVMAGRSTQAILSELLQSVRVPVKDEA